MTNKPITTQTVWEQMEPSSVHDYKVTSVMGGRFIKWGTAEQLVEAQSEGLVARVVRFKRSANLADYFKNNGEVLDE